ncbi:hypothetical protein P7F88_16165 [Vibrio hannami]|uniref:hypothetical protein n=1 Tax=Vibrio hannami TaxID=2717094 RepID=UPI00240EDB7B|nr:hypothetical protein [Vibrio hannami]MDG3087513.1 hypothetical protein [Vibrio hannami]
MLKKIKDNYYKARAAKIIEHQVKSCIERGLLEDTMSADIHATQIVDSVWEKNNFLLSDGLGKRPHEQVIAVYCMMCQVEEAEDDSAEERAFMSMLSDTLAFVQQEFNANSMSKADFHLLSICFEVIEPVADRYNDLSFDLEVRQYSAL